ncbi:MAG: methyltransferase domain-containing protein [Candidatus Wallbacteria bacterium]|nr:methyltransferase domain-containing protein [Candidatus Wallbacteria bacterium]
MAEDCWDPQQYERFKDERSQPFRDLAALVRRAPDMRVLDLGCGTGELTAWLHASLQATRTVGVDSSEAMISKASGLRMPGLSFEPGDITQWSCPPGSLDLIFSNAALQWVPGHLELVPKLCRALAPGGQLAVQVPVNFDHPSHTVAARIAAEAPFVEALGGEPRESFLLAPEEYATLLHGCGFAEQHVRVQVYGHQLGSRAEVVEWVKGTLLNYYRARLPAGLFEPFLERYRAALLEVLPDQVPFFYPFKRLLFWGRLPS